MAALRLRLGTRASALARWQSDWVAAQLRARGVEVELIAITTAGDVGQQPILTLGGTGVFTKELQKALLARQIDVAVHSLKDLPTDRVEGLVLAAVPERESPFDVLVSRDSLTLDQLPPGATIGTGSLRRRSQLLHARADLQMRDIRGNVDTRLKKLVDGDFDAIVLAQAGLNRLGLADRIAQVFEPPTMLPAVGQGALAIETREDDVATRAAVASLDDPATHAAVRAERTLLSTVGGGCLAPVGAWARATADGKLTLDGVVLSVDGRQRLTARGIAESGAAEHLGSDVAGRLIAQGARELIAQSRRPAG